MNKLWKVLGAGALLLAACEADTTTPAEPGAPAATATASDTTALMTKEQAASFSVFLGIVSSGMTTASKMNTAEGMQSACVSARNAYSPTFAANSAMIDSLADTNYRRALRLWLDHADRAFRRCIDGNLTGATSDLEIAGDALTRATDALEASKR